MNYNDNNDLFKSEAADERSETAPAGESSEYRIKNPENSRYSWRDADYAPHNAEPSMPRYHASESRQREVQKQTREEKRTSAKTFSPAGIIALCLVCTLLGGVAGGYTASSMNGSAAGPDTVSTPGPLTTADPGIPSSGIGAQTGGVLSGGEIYSLGCEQSVGISTEIATTNFFGMQTSKSVSGSGFIITEDGYILTNYHVIEGAYTISVMLYDGTTYSAEVVGYDDDNDVAVLKIEASGLSAVELGNSDALAVGDSVYAVGNPLGELAFTITDGIVSAKDRLVTTQEEMTGRTTTINMFQLTAAVNSGNSGGPVYNDRGQVVGIVTAKPIETGVEGIGFAIPINDAVKIANEIITNGYVTGKAYMGIKGQAVSTSAAQYYNMAEGVYITYVEEGSCAEKAGLLIGDIITVLDEVEITSYESLRAAIRSHSAGDTVDMTIWRSGETQSITITFDEELPDNGG